jgi:hypothetical protein
VGLWAVGSAAKVVIINNQPDSTALAQRMLRRAMDGQQVVEPRIPKRKTRFCDQHTVNRLVAKIIPVLLVGAAGFATWVYIAQICGTRPWLYSNSTVNWLMKRHGNTGLAGMLLSVENLICSWSNNDILDIIRIDDVLFLSLGVCWTRIHPPPKRRPRKVHRRKS